MASDAFFDICSKSSSLRSICTNSVVCLVRYCTKQILSSGNNFLLVR
jgi:hypothetical protein